MYFCAPILSSLRLLRQGKFLMRDHFRVRPPLFRKAQLGFNTCSYLYNSEMGFVKFQEKIAYNIDGILLK